MGQASVIWTSAAEGDFRYGLSDADALRRMEVVKPGQWFRVKQVHGAGVVEAGAEFANADVEADAIISTEPGITIAIGTADCGSIAMSSPEGIIAGVHAGWRGTDAGIINATASKMRELGATSIAAALGPCIHPECYEFDASLLGELASRWGNEVCGLTNDGKPALNMPAIIKIACNRSNVDLQHIADACTSCDKTYYSYRSRRNDERQIMLVWRP